MYHGKSLRVLRLADGIVELCFDREGEAVNKFDCRTVDELAAAVAAIRGAADVRGVLVTSAKGVFIAGADIFEFAGIFARSEAEVLAHITGQNAAFTAVDDLPVPSVAAINGFALGGGLELALACDLRVCSDTAKLGQPEVSLGIIPGAGATYRLPRLIGVGRAKDMILTARIVEATEALQMGLVNRVVPAAKVLAAAVELVEQCAVHSAPALRLAKEAIDTHGFGSFDAAMAFESTAQAVLFDDPEKHARMQAFLDRKAAK